MATVPSHEAANNLGDLMARAAAGEDVQIDKPGLPRIRLVPVASERPPLRTPGSLQGQITILESFFDPMIEDELKDWGY